METQKKIQSKIKSEKQEKENLELSSWVCWELEAMSSLAAFANLDVDKLITDIASRPAIWDKNFNGRQNKGFLEDTWDELVRNKKDLRRRSAIWMKEKEEKKYI